LTVFRNAPRASGYLRTGYAQDLALIQTRPEGAALAALAVALALFPFFAGAFYLDLACQVFLAAIGALSLMLLTGYAGQISLGHAGLLAAGAFTVGILFREVRAPFWLTLPAAALVGAVLGVIFGLPSLRLRGLYLAVSTLALYFVVAYLGGEYESRRGFSTGIMIDAPSIGGFALKNARGWYFVLLAAATATLLICANLLRSRTGRAWRAIRAHETVAEALGIGIASYKLLAFVISSALASLAGALFAYYRGFVSVEAFSLFLSIQYVAMIIIGGMGSLLGALLGALFVTLLPYLIEALLMQLPHAQSYAGSLFAIDYSAFGVVMILFLVFEPLGLVGIWRRLQNYFLLWPFKYRPVTGARR
jgi:branched-chain amino acid transport system permease protein